MTTSAEERARQGILLFMVNAGERESMTGRLGLTLVVEALRALHADVLVREHLKLAKRRRGYSEYEKLEALVLLLAAGGERVEDIQTLREDKGLTRLLGGELPSPDALLDLLNAFHDAEFFKQRPRDVKAWVPPEGPPLKALFEINRELVWRAASAEATTATIDHDGTIIEAHKPEALVAYEGTRGYQPLVAVWVEEDLIVGDEFRDGNVPGNMDPLASVQRAFDALPRQVTKRYFRGDSADYHVALLKYLVGEEITFTISADVSPALRACATELTEQRWVELEKRDREVVHVSELEFTPGDWPKEAPALRYIALRFTPAQGELFPEQPAAEAVQSTESGSPAADSRAEPARLKYLAVVTNRPLPPEDKTERARPDQMTTPDVVHWHWKKAGTIEHVHYAMKDELGAGLLPSQQFGSNAAWFRINVLAYNVLSFLKRRGLPPRYRTARPKRLRFEVFNLPGRLTSHQRQLTVDAAMESAKVEELIATRGRLLEIYDRGYG